MNVDVFLLFFGAFSSMLLGAWIVLRILRREYLPALVRTDGEAGEAGIAVDLPAEPAVPRGET